MMKKNSIFVIIVVIILFFVLPNCFKKPKWQSDITIPLYTKFFSIRDFIDSSYFKINSDSSLQFYKAGKIDTFVLLDSIDIQDRLDSVYTLLPDFVFTNLASANLKLTLDEISGLSLPETVINMVVPHFHQNLDTAFKIDNIRTASIKSGVIRMTIVNYTQVPFDSIICDIPDVVTMRLDNLLANSFVEFSQRIENIQVESILHSHLSFSSSGSGGQSIPISQNDSVRFLIKFDSLRINSGSFRAMPPRTVRVTKQKIYVLPVNYQIAISDLVFQDGNLSVSLCNGFPLSCSIRVSVPQLSFGDTLYIAQFDSTTVPINLAGKIYHNASQDSTPLTLRAIVEFELGTEFVNFVSDNFVKVSCLTTNLRADSITGIIKDTIKHNFPADTVKINLPDILSGVSVANAYADLQLVNGVYFPIYLTLNLYAMNNSGDSIGLDTTFYLDRGIPMQPTVISPSINFTRFINIHPDNVIFKIRLASFGQGWMNRRSFNTASYTVCSPLRFILNTDTVTFGPETLKINRDIREQVRKNAYAGTFNGLVSNHFPTGMSGELQLQNCQSDSIRIQMAIPKGVTNNAGIVIAPADSNVTLALSESDVQFFADSLLKIKLFLYLPQTDTITVMARDYFRVVNSYVKIRIGLPLQ